MTHRIGRWMVALGLLLFLWGCTKEKEQASPGKVAPSAQTEAPGEGAQYQPIAVQNGGTISGKVFFRGSWTPSNISVTKDQGVCGQSKREPSWMINKRGEVQYTVVQLADIVKGKAIGQVNPVLDQEGCEYKPHVLAVPAGTTVEIRNSDGILHNVHTFSEKNEPFNRAQPKYLKKITQTFEKAELISIKCDVHGWMSAWLFVVDHPYYDVTSANGTFELADVPPGTYTLEVWQEKLGKRTQRVKVGPNEKVEVIFEYLTKLSS